MRIAINGWFIEQLTTGSGQYLSALAEWLPRVGETHEWVVVRPANGESQIADPTASRTTHHASRITHHSNRTPFDHLNPNLAKLWFEQVAFPAACRRLRADVAFVPYWGSPWWQPCPVVVTIHDLIPLLLPAYRGRALQRAYTWLVGRTARRARAVLTDSDASKRDIVAHLGIPAKRVHAVPLAVDPRYQAATEPAAIVRIRTRYHLPDAPFLLYLGGFDMRKNVARMIEAFARITKGSGDGGAETGDGVRLVIAGKLPEGNTPFAPDPRETARRMGVSDVVHFTGWVDEADKPALYAAALGAIFVSEYEGFGLPVLEAMASAGAGGEGD